MLVLGIPQAALTTPRGVVAGCRYRASTAGLTAQTTPAQLTSPHQQLHYPNGFKRATGGPQPYYGV
jgi:hypothetical protein